MAQTPRILFVSAFETPFIRADLDFLAALFRLDLSIGHGFSHLLSTLMKVPEADVVFSWFASVYGSLAVLWGSLLGKKTVLQLGGVDMAKETATGYGVWTSPWKSAIVRWALRRADHVLVVDASLGDEARLRGKYDGRNIEVLETRFSPSAWFPSGEKQREILTVAAAGTEGRVHVKGIDVLLRAAERTPSVQFTIVGVDRTVVSRLPVPANVTLEGWSDSNRVRTLMQRARVYCQPSRREGLSNALCEAMLCGCVPVATDVGGTRRAVGDTGFVVPPDDASALADAIMHGVTSSADLGMSARTRIIHLFPEERRSTRLREIIEG